MRRLVTLFSFLLFAATALAFEEIPVPQGDASLGEAPGVQRFPAVATDGISTFFAVWSDEREGTPMLYGARLDAREFTIADPVGVRLLEGGARAAVAYGGNRFLVVDSLLQYALVDLESKVLLRGRIGGEPTGRPGILFNGRDFIVFYGHDAVHTATIDVDGRVMGDPTTVVPAAGIETQVHDAARYFSRERMVVLYSRGDELFGAVTSSAGAPLEQVRLGGEMATNARGTPQATIAAVGSLSGTGFLVAWHRDAADGVMALRLDVDGRPLGNAMQVATRASTPELYEIDGAFHLYTIEPGGVFLRRIVINAAGIFVDFPPARAHIALGPDGVGSFAVVRGRSVLGIVEHTYASQPDDSNLQTFGFITRTLSVAGRAQLRPAIAGGRDGEVTVWAMSAAEDPPSIAAVGSTYLVVRGAGNGVWIELIRGGGPVTNPILLDANGRWPVAAESGGDFIVAWTRSAELRIARVSTAGVVTATESIAVGTQSRPIAGLACDAGECILAWHEATIRQTCPRFACVVVDQRVKAIRFDGDLGIRDTLLLTPEPSTHRGRVVAAAHDGTYAVAWQDFLDVRAVTIDRSGAVESSVRVPGSYPAIARHRDSWLLVREAGERLVARWLPQGFERVLTPNDGQSRRAPSLFSLGDRVLLVYERTTVNEPMGGSPRAYRMLVEMPSPRRRAASFR